MEYTRNNFLATKMTQSVALIALLQQLKSQLNLAQPTQQTCHNLLDALIHALHQETPTNLITHIRRNLHQRAKPTSCMTQEQAQDTLNTIRNLRNLAQQKCTFRGRRKLDAYRQEIIQLYQIGASQHEIRIWLYREKRCRVVQSTISKYLKDIKIHGTKTWF
ncbi:MAG: hypothetical protein GKR77_06200 [Legionellales bacterium]|nr:hypothetical protein [Legionellales bacterium]